jgi:hypothetical protein
VDQASFGFSTIKDEWDQSSKPVHRTLVEVRLYDVSVVTFPAYPQTSVSARSLAEMLIAQLDTDPETLKYLRTQLIQLEANDEPEQRPHSAEEEAKRVRTHLAHLERKLEILELY